MAFQHCFPHVVLTEKDVPGASLPLKEISSNTIVSLRRWLETRGLKTSGKKAVLVERVEDCIDADLPVDIKVDGSKWYDLKLASLTAANPPIASLQPPVPPVTGWSEFPSSKIPKYFNKGHIYHYIVESASVVGLDFQQCVDIKIAKPLKRGEEYFRSGHVQNMKDCSVNNFYFVKSEVRASFENAAYDVLVSIDEHSGVVRDASCNCKASAMGRCSHVSGLLHAVADYLEKYGSTACTSKPCQWNQGRKTLRSPEKLSDCHGQERRKSRPIDFDPTDSAKENEEVLQKFETTLQRKRKTGWSLIFQNLNAKAVEEPNCKKLCVDTNYDYYELSEQQKKTVQQMRQAFLTSLKPAGEAEGPVQIVSKQGSEEWFRERSVRITASNCKAVKTAQTSQTKSNIVNRLLWSPSVSTKEMEYGRQKEKTALRDYIVNLHTVNCLLHVQESGLWINTNTPELACSPDSIITDSAGRVVGLVEVKCPFMLANSRVENFDQVLTKNQLSSFCLQRTSDGSIHLKRNHMYYFQIQMQMGVMEVEWCDFLVWSEHSFVVEKIKFDPNFWTALKRSLVEFHHKYLVPEYFEMRIPRGLAAVPVD